MKNVLIFPAGSEIGLELNKSLKFSTHFNIIAASSVEDHARFVFKNYIDGVPFITDKNFIDHINKLVEKYKIDYIFPAHDSVVVELSKAFKENNLKCPVITSKFEVANLCRSKKDTYNLFKDIIVTPKMLNKEEIKTGDFPLFLKPDIGQGSKGTCKVNSIDELQFNLDKDPSLLILEYLPGEEYTVDCFTNYKGELLFAEGRTRKRISNGISVNAIAAKDHRFKEIAKKINEKLEFQGMWFFQVKEDINGELSLLEISPRVAGTMGYHRSKGVNLPLLALFDKQGYDVNILKNNYNLEMDRALDNQFKAEIDFEHVYIDLDDTIILNDKVNPDVIGLLYQLKNENKSIYLITAHEDHFKNDTRDYLKKHYIDLNLFNDIINVKLDEPKSKHIKQKDSIFIDDSFAKRKEVLQNTGIPVFDISEINVLKK